MLSSIKIALEKYSAEPIIEIRQQGSDDLRDDVLAKFLQDPGPGGMLILKRSVDMLHMTGNAIGYEIKKAEMEDFKFSIEFSCRNKEDQKKVEDFFKWYKNVEKTD